MNQEQLTRLIVDSLYEVAPDLKGLEIKQDADLRREYDLDSVDFLAFVQSIHQKTGCNIPDADFGKFFSITAAVTYLVTHEPVSKV